MELSYNKPLLSSDSLRTPAPDTALAGWTPLRSPCPAVPYSSSVPAPSSEPSPRLLLLLSEAAAAL